MEKKPATPSPDRVVETTLGALQPGMLFATDGVIAMKTVYVDLKQERRIICTDASNGQSIVFAEDAATRVVVLGVHPITKGEVGL